MKYEEIKDLLYTVSKLELTDVCIETKEVKISLKKSSNKSDDEAMAIDEEKVENISDRKEKKDTPTDNKIIVDDPNMVIVESPIVGTIYLQSAPGEGQFVEIGQKVAKGQSLCIIEAMKLMNELRSEHDGTVVEIFVRNEQPVQFGQPIMLIKK